MRLTSALLVWFLLAIGVAYGATGDWTVKGTNRAQTFEASGTVAISATGANQTASVTNLYARSISGSGAGVTGVTAASMSWYGLLNVPTGLSDLSNTALATAELQQLQNINSSVLGVSHWGYLAGMNQGVSTTSSPTFAGLTLTGLLTGTGASFTAGVSVTGGVSITGTASAQKFVGDGSGLTNLPGGSSPTVVDANIISGTVSNNISSSAVSATFAQLTSATVIGSPSVALATQIRPLAVYQWLGSTNGASIFCSGSAPTSCVAVGTDSSNRPFIGVPGTQGGAIVFGNTTLGGGQLGNSSASNLIGGGWTVSGSFVVSATGQSTTPTLAVSTTTGRVGIGTMLAKAALDVSGEVVVSNTGLACSSAVTGGLRFQSTSDTLQVCTGSGWKSLASSTVAGGGASGLGALLQKPVVVSTSNVISQNNGVTASIGTAPNYASLTAVISATIVPTSGSSTLKICYNGNTGFNANIVMAVFQDGTGVALKNSAIYTVNNNQGGFVYHCFYRTAGSTSSRYYTVSYGNYQGTGTQYINANTSGSQFGTPQFMLTVEEMDFVQ